MIGNAPVSPLTGVPGWMTNDEETVLADYAGRIDQGTILEIGTEFGRSASVFASQSGSEVKVLCIDLFSAPDSLTICESNLKEAGLLPKITLVQGDSKTFSNTPKFRAKKIDLLYLDGDHSEAGVYQDLSDWTGKIKSGGYLLLHDCAVPTNKLPHITHYDVYRAVQRWQTEALDFVLVKTVDTLMVFQKV